jgi:hypothetical protein
MKQAARRLKRTTNAIKRLLEAQEEPQAETKLGRKFLDLLASAMASGQCHVTLQDQPYSPVGWERAAGWVTHWEFEKEVSRVPSWKIPPISKNVGHVNLEEQVVCLDPEICRQIVQDMMKKQGDYRSVSKIGRELMNENLCVVHKDGNRQRADQYRTTRSGGRKRYLVIPIATLWGEQPPIEEYYTQDTLAGIAISEESMQYLSIPVHERET